MLDDLPPAAFGFLMLVTTSGGVWAVTMTLLKAKYVLFAVGLAALVLLLPASLGPNGSAGGAVGVVTWIVAASRLAWPHSVWARWMYDAPRAVAAAARHGRPEPTGADPVRPERPRAVGLAFWLLVAGLVVGGSALSGWTVLAGLILPFAILTRTGWMSARSVTATLGGLGVVLAVIQVSVVGLYGSVVALLLGTAVIALAVVLFYRPSVSAYLRSRP